MPGHPPLESRAWLQLGPVKSLPGEPTDYLEDQFRWASGAGQEDVGIAAGNAAGAKWKQLLNTLTH